MSADLCCPICLQILVDAVETNCGHSFCELCVDAYRKGNSNCPVCREPITLVHPSYTVRKLIEAHKHTILKTQLNGRSSGSGLRPRPVATYQYNYDERASAAGPSGEAQALPVSSAASSTVRRPGLTTGEANLKKRSVVSALVQTKERILERGGEMLDTTRLDGGTGELLCIALGTTTCLLFFFVIHYCLQNNLVDPESLLFFPRS